MNKILNEAKSRLFWRDVSVEVIATFILMSVQCTLPLSWGNDGQTPTAFGSIVQQGLGMGFVVSATAWTFGDFGGCHMNPAVSFSMVIARQLSILKGKALLTGTRVRSYARRMHLRNLFQKKLNYDMEICSFGDKICCIQCLHPTLMMAF